MPLGVDSVKLTVFVIGIKDCHAVVHLLPGYTFVFGSVFVAEHDACITGNSCYATEALVNRDVRVFDGFAAVGGVTDVVDTVNSVYGDDVILVHGISAVGEPTPIGMPLYIIPRVSAVG